MNAKEESTPSLPSPGTSRLTSSDRAAGCYGLLALLSLRAKCRTLQNTQGCWHNVAVHLHGGEQTHQAESSDERERSDQTQSKEAATCPRIGSQQMKHRGQGRIGLIR